MATSTYSYQLRQPDGVTRHGSIQAPSYTGAVEQLRARYPGAVIAKLEVGSVKTSTGFSLEKLFQKPSMTMKEKLVFTEQLAVMVRAGITLPQALRGQAEEATRKQAQALISDLANQIEGGTAFSAALKRYPTVFSSVFVGMVTSAEQSGALSEVLMALTEQQRRDYELRRKVKGALTYPALISTLLIAVVALVIMFVIPRLTGLFEQGGVELPATTKALTWLSSFLTNQWYIVLGLIAGLVVGIRWLYSTEFGRLAIDAAILKIPVLGTFVKKAAIARFAQAFAFLSKAGVPVVEIFTTLHGVMGNVHYAKAVDDMAREVQNGIPLSTAVRKQPLFPGMVVQLVRAGEQSGDLTGMMRVLSSFFEGEVDAMAKNLSTLLEPIIMVTMGGVIGFVLISVLQPIYSLMNAVG